MEFDFADDTVGDDQADASDLHIDASARRPSVRMRGRAAARSSTRR